MDHLLRVVEGIAGNSNLWGELSFAFMQIQTSDVKRKSLEL